MSRRILSSLAICGALVTLVAHSGARAQGRSSSTILIVNGTVIDGTGSPARRAAVRIEGDAIAEVGDRLSARPGERVVDAAGLVVAPGFIDMHSHAGRQLGERPDAESQVRQGITTTLVGQDGESDLPAADFYESIDRLRPAINVATSVGAGTVRGLVMGGDFRRAATTAEVEVMKALVDRAMQDGAIGLSSGLEYDPGFYATPDEMVALASVVARYGGFYSSHVRDEEHEAFAAWREAIEVGRRAGVPVEISHIKVAVTPVWGTAAEGLRLLEDARRAGVRVMADWYPYTYWQSSMYVLIPDRDFENRERWRVGLDEIGGAANVLVTNYRPDPSFNGRTLEEIARAQQKDPVTLVIDMIRAAGPNIGIIGTSMDERDLETFVRHPQVLICSDGEIAGRHPRGFGTFPRVIARYVRDLKTLTIEEAVAKMTGRSAAQAGLADRGIVTAGRKADLVVFDPAAMADRATKQEPTQLSVGVRYVLVNGQIVLDDGRMTGARPGRGLRRMTTEGPRKDHGRTTEGPRKDHGRTTEGPRKSATRREAQGARRKARGSRLCSHQRSADTLELMKTAPLKIELPGWLAAKLANARPLGDVRARMAFAIELSRENVEHGTGGPFGAVIADTETGRVLSAGVNLVEHQTNSVLHAEVVAIMFAERALGAWTLAGPGRHKYEIVTSSAPCAMCLGAALWSGAAALVCGARTEDVQAIGFDEGPVFDESFDYLQQRGVLVVRDVMREEARAVLREYRARGGTIYNR